MPVVALTEVNLAFVKRSLRAALPYVSSSHLTESIAAGFGYRTHAAMLADPARKSSPVKICQGVEWLFVNRLIELGYHSVPSDTYSSVLWSQEMPDPVWQAFPKNDDYGRKYWYYACERRNIPYIHLELKRKLVNLQWDCISIYPDCDHTIRDERVLVRIMFRAFKAIASRKRATFEGSAFYGDVEGLLFDEARRLADGICLILNTASQPKKKLTAA